MVECARYRQRRSSCGRVYIIPLTIKSDIIQGMRARYIHVFSNTTVELFVVASTAPAT